MQNEKKSISYHKNSGTLLSELFSISALIIFHDIPFHAKHHH